VSHVFEPVRTEPAYRRVAAAIAARIIDRTLAHGATLPTELELAAQMGVHRSTLREALRDLESGGLLVRRKGTKRMIVARPSAGAVAHRLSHALALHDVTVDQLWEALMIVEPPAAEAAARRRDELQLETLRVAHAEYLRENGDARAAVAAVAAFFEALAAAAGNPVLSLAQAPVLKLLACSLELLIDRVPQARGRIATAQRELLAAIAAGDAATARIWMEKHLRDFRRGFEVAGIPTDFRVSLAPPP
jgi:GntR family transcriptional regulator, transcriptional repressor for pyruvate dehydrogenase complex